MSLFLGDFFNLLFADLEDEYDQWANRAEKSAAAEAREEAAAGKFFTMRRKFERAVVNHQKLLINLGSKLESKSSLKMLPSVLIDEIFEYVAATTARAENVPEEAVARRPRKSDSITTPVNAPKTTPCNIDTMYQAGMKYYMRLLDPDCHLTSACWRDFGRFVRSHQGWNVKRVEATREEKRLFGETRQGKVYFVYAFYTFPGYSSKKRSGSKKHASAVKPCHTPVIPANFYTPWNEQQRIKRARLAAGYAPDSKPPAKKAKPDAIMVQRIEKVARPAAGHVANSKHPAFSPLSLEQLNRARRAAGYNPDSKPPGVVMPPVAHSAIRTEQIKRARQAAGYVHPNDSKPSATKVKIPPAAADAPMSDKIKRARQAAGYMLPQDSLPKHKDSKLNK